MSAGFTWAWGSELSSSHLSVKHSVCPATVPARCCLLGKELSTEIEGHSLLHGEIAVCSPSLFHRGSEETLASSFRPDSGPLTTPEMGCGALGQEMM